jgi:hypothetical protein
MLLTATTDPSVWKLLIQIPSDNVSEIRYFSVMLGSTSDVVAVYAAKKKIMRWDCHLSDVAATCTSCYLARNDIKI